MIRNKTPAFIQFKSQKQSNRFRNAYPLTLQQPWWFEQFYQNKETLQRISSNNANVAMLANQYRVNPTVYALKQVERLITENCQLIDSVDRWVNNFRYSQPGTASRQNEKSICKYFSQRVSQQIMAVFNSKQIIASVNNQLDHQMSFNNSYTNHNVSSASIESNQRHQVFEEVNYKIENLNIILRRMNAVVASQGELVNRIDENLISTHQNMEKANEQLDKRVEKQQGEGEFSCEGKVNKIIIGLYVVNLILILVFLLKNVLF